VAEHAPSPFDALAAKYDSWYDGRGRVAFESELAAVRAVLPECPKPWLEVGVGTGRFAQALGIRLGIDPSVGLLELARRRGVEALYGEGEELVFRPGSFGTVFLLTTWEFLREPARVLTECRRVLRPEGRLVNGYLDRGGKWGRSYIEKAEAGHPLFSQAHFDAHETVRRQTEAAGFRITLVVSTLFSGPDEPQVVEAPAAGFVPGASFVVIAARPAASRASSKQERSRGRS
jgi:ubiquinone/menaquinone biosynthesis C-methylase UbiE